MWLETVISLVCSKQECHSHENKLLQGADPDRRDRARGREHLQCTQEVNISMGFNIQMCYKRHKHFTPSETNQEETTEMNNSNKTIITCKDTKRWMTKCSLRGGAFSLTSHTQRSARLQTFKYISILGKLHTGSHLELKIKFVSPLFIFLTSTCKTTNQIL